MSLFIAIYKIYVYTFIVVELVGSKSVCAVKQKVLSYLLRV